MKIFISSPIYKDKKYQIDNNYYSCQNKKTVGGLSQKLIKDSLIEYISIKKLNIDHEDLMNFILNNRSVTYKDTLVIADIHMEDTRGNGTFTSNYLK